MNLTQRMYDNVEAILADYPPYSQFQPRPSAEVNQIVARIQAVNYPLRKRLEAKQ